MDQRELHGGFYSWWPPTKDHVILYKANPVRFEYFRRFVADWTDVKILDVGCGGGYACEHLARLEAVVSGTDILQESLQEACDHAAQNNLKIDYRLCTPEHLPYDNNSMELVTCFDVLEHVLEKETILSEIHRVLAPGGWLFFDTLNKTFWSKLLTIWLGEMMLRLIERGTHDWRHFLSPDDLRQLLETQGFERMEFAGIRLDWRRWAKMGVPASISSNGNTAIIYFGAATKRIEL